MKLADFLEQAKFEGRPMLVRAIELLPNMSQPDFEGICNEIQVLLNSVAIMRRLDMSEQLTNLKKRVEALEKDSHPPVDIEDTVIRILRNIAAA